MPNLPLYLLPGLLCDAWIWQAQADALAPGRPVTTPAFLGFDSLTRMAESVLETAPPRFALAGHSMGGRVALEIVRLAPERVERLALFDSGTTPPQAHESKPRQVMIDLAYSEGMAALAARWIPAMVHPARLTDRPLMDALTAMVCRATPRQHEMQIQALLTRRDAAETLAALKCPVLLGCGRQDERSPLAQHEAMAARVPQSRLAVIEDCAHMSTVERPETVTALLGEWLAAA